MKERLTIRNFGPIKSMDLDLGKMTVLIGDQATGKSTVAKVLSICRYFSYIVTNEFNIDSQIFEKALADWGLKDFENKNTYIEYSNSDYNLIFKSNNITIDDFDDTNIVPFLTPESKRFKNLIKSYNELKPKKKGKLGIYPDWHIPHSFLTTDVKSVMNNPFYFPTERGLQSFMSIGKSGVENINDRLFEQLAAINNISSNFKRNISIDHLGVEYKYESNQALFKDKTGEYYKLNQGASGYQSSIPIVLAIKHYSETEKRKRTFIVEEPEISLFPEAQKKLIEFFVEYKNKFDHSFLLTTHSPYVLTALENLMYAHNLGNNLLEDTRKKVRKVVDEKFWLNPKDVSVYFLKDGIASDILDSEEALINKDYLDSVSDIINTAFDQLLEIESQTKSSL